MPCDRRLAAVVEGAKVGGASARCAVLLAREQAGPAVSCGDQGRHRWGRQQCSCNCPRHAHLPFPSPSLLPPPLPHTLVTRWKRVLDAAGEARTMRRAEGPPSQAPSVRQDRLPSKNSWQALPGRRLHCSMRPWFCGHRERAEARPGRRARPTTLASGTHMRTAQIGRRLKPPHPQHEGQASDGSAVGQTCRHHPPPRVLSMVGRGAVQGRPPVVSTVSEPQGPVGRAARRCCQETCGAVGRRGGSGLPCSVAIGSSPASGSAGSCHVRRPAGSCPTHSVLDRSSWR